MAVRGLGRQKAYSVLTILGLALGLAATSLIVTYVRGERAFDRYHDRADRIHRVYMDRQSGGDLIHWARTPAPVAPMLKEFVPGIEGVVRIRTNPRTDLVTAGDREFYEAEFYFADSTVFDVFSFELLQGDYRTALSRPHSVVLTEAMADKYFGQANPVGETITFEKAIELTITGVLAEVPRESHFRFDFLASFGALEETLGSGRLESWAWTDHHTYVLLAAGAAMADVEARLPAVVEAHTSERFSASTTLRLQPLTSIHLDSKLKDELGANGNATALSILLVVAGFILLLACVNFTNLATARSANRAKEIGMRKVLGASRLQLMVQFLGESVAVSLGALVVSLGLIGLGSFALVGVTGGDVAPLRQIRSALPFLVPLALGAGLIAGLYPAVMLSSGDPRSRLAGAGRRRGRLRKVLVTFQFVVSIALLIGTAIVSSQFAYLSDTRLGFDANQVLVIPVRDRSTMRDILPALKDALQRHTGVLAVSGASTTPGAESHLTLSIRPEGASDEIPIATILSDLDFVDTYGLELVQGRDLSEDLASDSTASLLINQAAARLLGYENPVGREVEFGGAMSIAGVVRDFQFQSLHHPVQPLIIVPSAFYRFIAVKLAQENIPETIAFVERTWSEFWPDRPLEYSFLDAEINRQYLAESRLSDLFRLFAGLGALIACLGLIGLASFSSEQRRKEIGVRKTLGASTTGVATLMVVDFAKLSLLAFCVGAPLAYYFGNRWLSGFAHRTEIGVVPFLAVAGGVLLLTVLSVGLQSTRAALRDPVESLRYE
jgi:putative ABC transport system permease protein